MKLYDSIGPNPRLVRMVLQEKGVELPFETVDILGGENRKSAYLEKNPAGQIPALELDDGRVIAETLAISEYLEELHPSPPLVGATPEERAETRMWLRRIELGITLPKADGFRFSEGLPMFKDRVHTIPQAADDLKAIGNEGLAKLDGVLRDRDYIAGERFSLADILLYAFLDFFPSVGQPLDPALTNLAAWFERVGARPSAEASLQPLAQAAAETH